MKPRPRKTTTSGGTQVSARVKVVDLLSRREHSQFELQRKLLTKGYSPEEIEDALSWAKTLDLQSDSRFGTSLFRRRAAGYGDKAIEYELAQHHVPKPEDSQDRETEDPDWASEEERAYQWLVRRDVLKNPPFEACEDETIRKQWIFTVKARAFRALSARGFQFGNIEKAWKRFEQNQDDWP